MPLNAYMRQHCLLADGVFIRPWLWMLYVLALPQALPGLQAVVTHYQALYYQPLIPVVRNLSKLEQVFPSVISTFSHQLLWIWICCHGNRNKLHGYALCSARMWLSLSSVFMVFTKAITLFLLLASSLLHFFFFCKQRKVPGIM